MHHDLPAHRPVLGVSGDTEVLRCGHTTPRFDRTPAFASLATQGFAAFPRVRACRACPPETARVPPALLDVDAPVGALAWWASRPRSERLALLREVAPELPEGHVLLGSLPRAALPTDAGRVLAAALKCLGERAAALELDLYEWGSLSSSAPPTLSGWALVRAAARRHEARH